MVDDDGGFGERRFGASGKMKLRALGAFAASLLGQSFWRDAGEGPAARQHNLIGRAGSWPGLRLHLLFLLALL